MPETSRFRRWMTIPVLVFGALTTMATSPPSPVQLVRDVELWLEPGEAVHVQIVINEVAMDHVRRFFDGSLYSITVEVNGEDVRTVADDDAFPPQAGWGGIRFLLGLDACPESGGCRLGYTIESTGASEHAVLVRAIVDVEPETAFLFGTNRDFPEAAAIHIVVDGE